MPFEYCEYYSNSSKCKEWLEKNLPDMFAQLYTSNGKHSMHKPKRLVCSYLDFGTILLITCLFLQIIIYLESENPTAEDGDDEQSKKGRQKRGGKALLKPKKKETGEKFVKLARANRGKKKYVTGLCVCFCSLITIVDCP